MKDTIWKIIRITTKVLLCVSLIVSVNLLFNYIRNLNPTADGFNVANIIARLIHGDGYWTWENLTMGLAVSFNIFIALFCIDKIFDMIFCKKNKA